MNTDVVIVGGGPGGATSALFLLQQGIRPLIIEAEAFPRYHIGESMTGMGGALLRQLGLEEKMNQMHFPVKQGVKVYGQGVNNTWFVPVAGRENDWKIFPWYTWQVRRSEFDKMLLDEAISRGASLLQAKALKAIVEDGVVCGVQVRQQDGSILDVHSRMLLDCSGQATWLANQGGITGPKYLGAYDRQIAIFSQVKGALRDHGEQRSEHCDNTLIFYKRKYHWAWFIPLDEEVVSVGVVIPSAYFQEKNEIKRDFLLRELKELHPDLSRRTDGCPLIEDVHVINNYSYQVKNFAGKGYICIGDAHRFVDPIFSFGLTLSMREAQIAAPLVHAYLDGAYDGMQDPFASYQLACEKGIDVLEDTIDAFWEKPLQFALYVHQRHTESMGDLFAGRVYANEHQPSEAVEGLRRLLGRTGQREQSYQDSGLYSIPIGSRYHPERAPLWESVPETPLAEPVEVNVEE